MWPKIKLIGLLISVVIISSYGHWAQAATPFANFREFVRALDDMPAGDFALKGKGTSLELMRTWFSSLSELNPEPFEEWNTKLRLLPTIGFVPNPTLWELHPLSDGIAGVGFMPEVQDTKFVSIVDFYRGVQLDRPEIFQKRLSLTSVDEIEVWMEILNKAKPKLAQKAEWKAALASVAGYVNAGYELRPPLVALGPIGFKPDPEKVDKPFETKEDFLKGYRSALKKPEEFQRRMALTREEDYQVWITELKPSMPRIEQGVTRRLKARTEASITVPAEDAHIIRMPTIPDPQAVKGLNAHRACKELL